MRGERWAIPSRGAVDLWYARPGPLADTELRCRLDWLSSDEVERWERFRVPRARSEFLVGKVMTREVLSRYQDAPPEAWRFVPNDKGRPRIGSPPSPLKFNLTHTTGLVVLAVATDEVGVDTESLERRPPWSVAGRCFSASERAAMERFEGEAKRDCFFDHWTLKEAYIKARGIGIGLPLGKIVFELAEGGARLVEAPDDDPSRWHFARRNPTGTHPVAVALGVGTPVRLTERWWPES